MSDGYAKVSTTWPCTHWRCWWRRLRNKPCRLGTTVVDAPSDTYDLKRQELLDLLAWGPEHGFPTSLEEAMRMDEEERKRNG